MKVLWKSCNRLLEHAYIAVLFEWNVILVGDRKSVV